MTHDININIKHIWGNIDIDPYYSIDINDIPYMIFHLYNAHVYPRWRPSVCLLASAASALVQVDRVATQLA
jgi:hypothetical protein